MSATPSIAIVGGGAAGLSAALAASAAGHRVVIFTDRAAGRSNSTLAQGGLQFPPTAASERLMIDDMIRSGGDSSQLSRIIDFVKSARGTIQALQAQGLSLDLDERKSPKLRLAGGMSEPRIVTSGDRIGAPVMRLLLRLARSDNNIEIRERSPIRAITPGDNGLVVESESDANLFRAVVCATGGTAWRQAAISGTPTSNPPNENHQMFDLLSNLVTTTEQPQFQYQPFGDLDTLDDNGVGKLIPESIVGFDIAILNRRGESIADPRSGRLAIRQAMLAHEQRGLAIGHPSGFPAFRLTLSAVSPALVKKQYPTLARRLEARNALTEDILITPFLHYQLSGLDVRVDGSTQIPGLFLAGEITGGLHGKNRLMGNGLTESLVCGTHAGRAAAHSVDS